MTNKLLIPSRSISAKLIYEEACKMWLETKIINRDKNVFEVSNGQKTVLFKLTDFGWNSSLWFKIAQDKVLTNSIVEILNINVPKSATVSEHDKVDDEFLKSNWLKYPLVVKPIDWGHWLWITTNILNITQLNTAIDSVKKTIDKHWYNKSFIIQKYITGDEHRVFVLWDKVVFCVNRINAYVVGNGTNSVKELIEEENKNPLRWKAYEKPMTFIEIDDDLAKFIKTNYNIDINYVPKENEKIILRWVSNIWKGWYTKDCSNIICDEIKQDCINIAKKMWLEITGIDVLTSDISKPLNETWWVILEVNATPSLWGFGEVTWKNIAKEILDYIFK